MSWGLAACTPVNTPRPESKRSAAAAKDSLEVARLQLELPRLDDRPPARADRPACLDGQEAEIHGRVESSGSAVVVDSETRRVSVDGDARGLTWTPYRVRPTDVLAGPDPGSVIDVYALGGCIESADGTSSRCSHALGGTVLVGHSSVMTVRRSIVTADGDCAWELLEQGPQGKPD